MNEDNDILIIEQCGSIGSIITYTKQGNSEIALKSTTNPLEKSVRHVRSFFHEILLPYGYPDSVSEDYFNYQVWDTAQAFCSTITGAFTTRAVLKGVGVGDSEASALSAAITWILKDGTGMVGRIVFAWWKGNGLDSDCKKWRLFADILNDAAMTIELFLPYLRAVSMHLLCLTSAMKSIVGIAGGATRASITHHQAVKDNMAEISAKDGSQETLVNLVASFASIYLLQIFNGTISEWAFIFTLFVIHLWTNYLAVKSLIFKTFNDQRLAIVLKTYFNIGTVLNPYKVNEREAVILGCGLKMKDFCGFNIVLGESMSQIIKKWKLNDFKHITSLYNEKRYLLLVDLNQRIVYVVLEKGITIDQTIAAYFNATCLAIATCIYNGIELDIYSKRQLRHPTPITRLYTFMRSYERPDTLKNLQYNHLVDLEDFVKQEYSMFHTALSINGWNLSSLCLSIGEWRSDWKSYSRKSD